MGVFICVFVWMVFVFGESTAQFKVLGLLDPTMGSDLIDSTSPLVKIQSFEENHGDATASLVHSSQARGFSDEQMDKTATLENATSTRNDNSNIIKVRIMEDESTNQRTNINEPTIIDNAIGINNGLETDDILQSNLGPLTKPKAFQPNIRKFSYVEERSFHQNGNNRNTFAENTFDGGKQRNDYGIYKMLKYRNHYKSKCRCERIWNCPKIQITIHRCQQDYFMCCF